MLKEIRIKNLSVVESVELKLAPGLNVLTGSTGTGKSLILGAVNLLLGHRAAAGSIRAGEDRAIVECVLSTVDPDPGSNVVGRKRGGDVRLRREINKNGRNSAFVDDEPVTLAQLRQVCVGAIEPHGQNEQLRLKDPENHAGYLDAFAENSSQLDRYRERLQAFKNAEKELADFDARISLLKEKQELLRHRVEEIDRAGVAAGEIDALEKKIGLLENAEKIVESLGFVCSALDEDESGASPAVSQSIKRLNKIAHLDDRLQSIATLLHGAEVTLKECAQEARSYAETIEFDPQELQLLQERRAYLLELERRYASPLEGLVRLRDEWAAQLESLTFETEERRTRQEDFDKKSRALAEAAGRLSESRRSAAKRLDKQMTAELSGLMMPGARFRTEVRFDEEPGSPLSVGGCPVAAKPDGVDVVRFLVRTNRGEQEGSVSEIASSGEISRIALALKKLTHLGKPGSVLIFDELDAGVGADLGGVISEKLLDLSEAYQIICITHLPQIAAKGQRHLVVSKRSDGKRTFVEVAPVEGENRRREIARMLGGTEGSNKRMALAAELLEEVKSNR